MIHDVISTTKESIHTIHTNKLEALVMKVYLHKAYKSVEYSYIRLILNKIGLSPHNVEWIMVCMSSICYDVLINGFPSSFYRADRGLRQGFSLSPLLFILFMDELSLKIKDAQSRDLFGGLFISPLVVITHLFFVDDILTFVNVSRAHWSP